MVDSEFGVNNIKTWLHPTLNQCFLYTGGGLMTHPFSSAFLYQGCGVTAAYFPLHFGYSAQNLKLVS